MSDENLFSGTMQECGDAELKTNEEEYIDAVLRSRWHSHT